MEPGIAIKRHGVNDWDVLQISGEIDIFSVPRLRETAIEVVDESKGAPRLALDLTGVDFLDSTGLGALVAALKRLRVRDGELRLVCTEERILKILRITGLTKVFPIYGSKGAATRDE